MQEPPSASFYHVEIERQGLAGLGLQLEAMQDEYCLVIGIKEGLIEHWNAQQETPEMQVRPWDRLVEAEHYLGWRIHPSIPAGCNLSQT
eukprot:g22557.t1